MQSQVNAGGETTVANNQGQRYENSPDRGRSPVNMQQRNSVIAENYNKSPRVQRGKNLSPPSRDKVNT